MDQKKEQLMDRIVGMIIMICLLIPQYFSTQAVFAANDKSGLLWIAWFYALGIDSAVLYCTWKGWIKTALAYMVISFAHNISYHISPQSIGAVFLISSCSPGTIFTIGHLFLHRKKERKKAIDSEKIPEKVWQIHRAMEAGIHFEAQPFVCPECNATFSDRLKLNGHITSHKKNNEWKPEHYGDWESENHQRYQQL
ncbi:C2H2-type zinc finger protein [uncultured Aquimarina sp.]|uniref:C2H2-type zinc finger protein n=1 Tax=uncultured Aquimarina sp. TaxID=575652 RepID=UPI002613254A|nr:C2H2-type zinc finger protein [uncultured Aquimarina sp.]